MQKLTRRSKIVSFRYEIDVCYWKREIKLYIDEIVQSVLSVEHQGYFR